MHRFIFVSMLSLLVISCLTFQKEQANKYIDEGNAFYNKNDYRSALNSYLRAQELDSTLEIGLVLVDVYFRLNDYPQAREMLDILLQSDKENEIIRELDAYYYLRVEDNQKAIELYTALIDDTTFQSRALSNLGLLYGRLEQFEDSYYYFREAIRIASIDVAVLRAFSTTLLAMKQRNLDETLHINIEVDLQFVVEKTAEAYTAKKVPLSAVTELAQKLLDSGYAQYSFSLYAFLVREIEQKFDEAQTKQSKTLAADVQSDTSSSGTLNADSELEASKWQDTLLDTKEDKELKEVLFILSQMLLDKNYDIIVPQRFLQGLKYLEIVLEADFGTALTEKTDLKTLLDKAPTDVLSKRISQLFQRYNISFAVESEG